MYSITLKSSHAEAQEHLINDHVHVTNIRQFFDKVKFFTKKQ